MVGVHLVTLIFTEYGTQFKCANVGDCNLNERTEWQKDHLPICERTEREF
jgi:hypothetical protein